MLRGITCGQFFSQMSWIPVKRGSFQKSVFVGSVDNRDYLRIQKNRVFDRSEKDFIEIRALLDSIEDGWVWDEFWMRIFWSIIEFMKKSLIRSSSSARRNWRSCILAHAVTNSPSMSYVLTFCELFLIIVMFLIYRVRYWMARILRSVLVAHCRWECLWMRYIEECQGDFL